jgi:hypothetical protein
MRGWLTIATVGAALMTTSAWGQIRSARPTFTALMRPPVVAHAPVVPVRSRPVIAHLPPMSLNQFHYPRPPIHPHNFGLASDYVLSYRR